MENIIYERDYEKEYREEFTSSTLAFRSAVLEVTRESGIFETFQERMQRIPKMIVPQDRANYEYLLPRLDALARSMGGKIRAEINYQKWDSSIVLVLPFLEFCDQAGYALLKDITEKSDSFNVTATEDGQVRVYVSIDYFEEIGIDAAGKRAIFNEELAKLPDLFEIVEDYRKEALKQELELKTGVPGALMDEDMLWFIRYCKRLAPEQIDELIDGYFADCVGDQHKLLLKVRQFRKEVEENLTET